MPINKIKSPSYLNFLGSRGCFITGKTSPDLHHEAVHRKYLGGMKKYFDFGAIPLNHELHLYERHQWGREEFWQHYGLDPVDVCIQLLTEYVEDGQGEDLDIAKHYLDELLKERTK